MEGHRQGRAGQSRRSDPTSVPETWAWSTHAAGVPGRGVSRVVGGPPFPDQVGSTRVLSAASGDGASVAGLELQGRSCRVEEDDELYELFMAPPMPKALVPWKDSGNIRIDRFDARHLLDVLPLPKKGAARRKKEDPLIDAERYADLARLEDERAKPREEWERRQEGSGADRDSASYGLEHGYGEGVPAGEATRGLAYSAVPFSYGAGAPDAAPSARQEATPPPPSPFTVPLALPQPFPHETPSTEKHYNIMVKTARFVAQHGGQSEIVLRVKQGHVPTFSFLMPGDPLHPFFRYVVENPAVLQEAISGAQPQLKPDATQEEQAQTVKGEEKGIAIKPNDEGIGSGEEVGVKEGARTPQDAGAASKAADAISLLGSAYADEEGDESDEAGKAGGDKEGNEGEEASKSASNEQMITDDAGAVQDGVAHAASPSCLLHFGVADQEVPGDVDSLEQTTATDAEGAQALVEGPETAAPSPQRQGGGDEGPSEPEASEDPPRATKTRVTLQLKEVKRKKKASEPDHAPGLGGLPAWAQSKRLKSVPRSEPESTQDKPAESLDQGPSTVDQRSLRDVEGVQAVVEVPESADQAPQLQPQPQPQQQPQPLPVTQGPEPSVQSVHPGDQIMEPVVPEDEAAVKVIMKMVEYIARNGPQFEQIVRDRDEQQARALQEQQPEGAANEEWTFRRFAFLEPAHPHYAFFITQLQIARGDGQGEHAQQEQAQETLAAEGQATAATEEGHVAGSDHAVTSGSEVHAGASVDKQETGLMPEHQDPEDNSSGTSASDGENDSDEDAQQLDSGPRVSVEESPKLPKLSAAAVAAAVRAATSRQNRSRINPASPDHKQGDNDAHHGRTESKASALPAVDAETEALLEGDDDLIGQGIDGSRATAVLTKEGDASEDRERKRKERLAKARLLLKGSMAPNVPSSIALGGTTTVPVDVSLGKTLDGAELEDGEIGDHEVAQGKAGAAHDAPKLNINDHQGNNRIPGAPYQPVSRLRALRQELEREDDEFGEVPTWKERPGASKRPGSLAIKGDTADAAQAAFKEDIEVPLDLRSKVRQMLQGLKSGL